MAPEASGEGGSSQLWLSLHRVQATPGQVRSAQSQQGLQPVPQTDEKV